MQVQGREFIKGSVRKNYAKIAKGEKTGCCVGGCGSGHDDGRNAAMMAGYTEKEISSSLQASNMGLGCGNPIALAELREGETVLDLGSGGGFDCFLARRRVGASGYVIGVDMTPEMVSLAKENAGKSGFENVEFMLGEIEKLPVADETVDVVLSNCVINLSPEKQKVFAEAYRVLKKGGRLCISDTMLTEKMPDEIRGNTNLICACIGGAENKEKVKGMAETAGFKEVELTQVEGSRELIRTWAPGLHAENFLSSFMIRAVK